jgi:hypothetical protein
MFKEYRYEVAVISALFCVYNLYMLNPILSLVCGVAAVGNYYLAKEGK